MSASFTLGLALAFAWLPACGSGGSTSADGGSSGGGDGGGSSGSCPTSWGTLVPFAAIASDDVVRDMHAVGSTLYYSSQGGIFSVPLAGGTPMTVVSVPSPGAIQAFTVLSDGIAYVQGTELEKVATSGGSSPTMLGMLADYQGQALERSGDVWTDGKTVVWPRTTTDNSGNTLMGIRAMDLSTQKTTDLVMNATDTLATVSVVGSTVYYNEGVAPGAPGASKVQSVPIAGGSPTAIETSGVMAAVDSSALYWGSAAGEGFVGSISRSPLSGGSGSSFDSGLQVDVGNAVFVDTRAFFAGVQNGASVIVQAPRSGGSAQVVFCLGTDDTYSIDTFDVSGKTLYVGLTRNADMQVGIVTAPLP